MILVFPSDPLGGFTLPIPLAVTADGLPAALCAIDSVPCSHPTFVGTKVTVTVWLAPAVRLKLVGEAANCALLEVMLLMERVPPPELVTVKVVVPEVPLVTGLERGTEVAERVIAGGGVGWVTVRI